MWLAMRFLLGVSAGLLLVFLHRSTKGRRFGAKVLLGFAAGFGIFMVFNAAIEVIGYLRPPSRATVTQEIRWPDGTLKARREGIEDGAGGFIAHGKATSWHENGRMKWRGEYRDGRQVGKWMEWYETGQKEGEGEMREDGPSFEVHWYPSGRKKSEGPGRGSPNMGGTGSTAHGSRGKKPAPSYRKRLSATTNWMGRGRSSIPMEGRSSKRTTRMESCTGGRGFGMRTAISSPRSITSKVSSRSDRNRGADPGRRQNPSRVP